MKNYSATTANAHANARTKGLKPRWFVWIVARNRVNGGEETFGFWTGDRGVALNVINGQTGLPIAREFHGGVNLEVGDIPLVSDLTDNPVEIKLSAIAEQVQEFFRGADPKGAYVEIHYQTLAPESNLPVDDPEIEYIGIIDDIDVPTGPVGNDSLVSVQLRPEGLSMQTRINPRKRSDAAQSRRQGDRFRRYGNSVGSWEVPWGEKGKSTAGSNADWVAGLRGQS